MLNYPPSNAEKYSFHNTNKSFFYLSSLLSSSTLIIGIFLFSISSPSLIWYLVYAVVLLVYLGLSFAVGIFSEEFNLARHECSKVEPDKKPMVDVFLPSCGEPIEIIKATIIAAKKMAFFYRWATLYVLDDAKNPELEELCKVYGITYIVRDDNYLKKAGNLRNAFGLTHGEWILVLDADFAPRADMLEEIVPLITPKTAIIQTPQYFRVEKGMSFIEKGAGFVQELFYRMIQVNRNHFGASVCVGTCAMYRREALEPFGGTAPIAYSEDLHTGFAVMTHGWEVKYFPINLAAGLCPDTIRSYFTQQYRWCMGSFTLMLNKEFWTAQKITWIQRACFLTGMLYYITTALSVVMTAVPSLIVLWFYPHLASKYSVMFSLPSLLVGTIVIACWSKHRFGLYAIEARLLAYWAHLFAIVDKLRGNLMPWVPTGNVQKNTRYNWFRGAFLFYSVTLTTLLALGAYENMESVEIIPMLVLTGFYRLIDLRIASRLFMEK